MERRRGGIPSRKKGKRETDAVHTGIVCKTPLRANHYQSVHTTSTQTKTKKSKRNHRRFKKHPQVAGEN